MGLACEQVCCPSVRRRPGSGKEEVKKNQSQQKCKNIEEVDRKLSIGFLRYRSAGGNLTVWSKKSHLLRPTEGVYTTECQALYVLCPRI